MKRSANPFDLERMGAIMSYVYQGTEQVSDLTCSPLVFACWISYERFVGVG